ncbi:MAG: replication initiation protein, partial [Bacteroidota bacterium]
NSQYSMRIYELLKQYEFIGKRKIGVEKLRHMLMLENKYESYNLFKRKVIEKARLDLDKNCDIGFTYQEFKTGRKITSIEFLIHKRRVKSDTPKIEEKPDTIENALLEMGITKSQVKKYLHEEQREERLLRDLIAETKRRYEAGKVKNPAAYLVRLIESGASVKSSFVKREEQKKEVKAEKQSDKATNSKKEIRLIEKLQKAFQEVRKNYIKALIADFAESDWEEFAVMINDSKYGTFARKIVKDGVVNRKAAANSVLMMIFLSNRLRSEHKHFIEWAYQKHGYQLERQGDTYRIVGSQASLF